jgi:hypothetical protein
MGKLPERKPNRSKEIAATGSVSGSGSVGASVARPPLPVPSPHPLSVHPSHPLPMSPLPAYTHTKLSPIGKIIENEIAVTQSVRASVIVDCNVIMPNHVHMIIRLNCGEGGGWDGGMDGRRDGRGGRNGRGEGGGRGGRSGRSGRATLAPTEPEHTVNNILKMSVLFLK